MFVAVCGSTVSASASSTWGSSAPLNQGSDRIRLADNAECTSSNTPNKRLETGSILDTLGNTSTYIKFTYEFGSDTRKLDCNVMYNLQVERQMLDLERLRVEVEVLQLERQKLIESVALETFNTDDDW